MAAIPATPVRIGVVRRMALEVFIVVVEMLIRSIWEFV
jgi:hypothetical protein